MSIGRNSFNRISVEIQPFLFCKTAARGGIALVELLAVIAIIEDDLVYETNGRGIKEVVAETTPHEIEITPDGKKNQAAFELGKAVKERL